MLLVRRLLLAAVVASTWIVGTTGLVASASPRHLSSDGSSARSTAPTWSSKWVQANPGQPLVLILDPRAARLCFVGLHSSKGFHAVGWRFIPGGHRLSLTLLTHADASGGSWVLSASCQRLGANAHSAKVTISVPSPGGDGVLAAHGDMRVQLLPGTSNRAPAATPAQNAHFSRTMKGLIGSVFKQKAPKLLLDNVSCVLAQSGTSGRCQAHFKLPEANANVVYVIKADIKAGTVHWTTTSHSCSDSQTGKPLNCNPGWSRSSSTRWRTVKGNSTSGQHATTATRATIPYPSAIAVVLKGGGGEITWACTKGSSISAWSKSPSSPGFYVLAHVAGNRSCDVKAGVGGHGRVSVTILNWG
jgi:hypothetical protein